MSNQLIESAQQAHKEGDFDKMCGVLQQIIQSDPCLNAEIRNMLFIAYKGAAAKRRSQLKENSKNASAAKDLESYCAEFINLISQTLIPNAKDAEAKVFFYKCMGDFYRYYDEVQPNQTNKSSAINSYENACHLGTGALDPSHPLLLNVALNHGVCCTEQLNDTRRGLEITEKAIDSARSRLSSLDERKKMETSFVLTLLLDNAKLWRKELNMPEPKPIEGLLLPAPPQQQGQAGAAPQPQQQQKMQQGQYAPQQHHQQYAPQPAYGR